MKLTDICLSSRSTEWEEKGYRLPRFCRKDLVEKTRREPTWLHFGAGNIFRAFPASVLQQCLDAGIYDRGVIVAEGFDYEIIDKAYRPYDNLSLLVTLKSDGTMEKQVVASVTESLKADPQFPDDWARLAQIIRAPSLQMVSFTITEKGYGVSTADLERGLSPQLIMGKVAALLYQRYLAGAAPITLQSMDNCSHNGDKLKAGVIRYAERWTQEGLVDAGFLAYLNDPAKVTFPWSMIDKITPRPDETVRQMLMADGFEDHDTILTSRGTYTAPFVNAEQTQYLVLEDQCPNGRPPLDVGGVVYASRETVDQVERMKVCTCLNPLHTALAIFGCLLGYDRICAEMKDEDLAGLVTKMGYLEAMPVVSDPGVLDPAEFIGGVLKERLPNPFLPDSPQRIATDTSQKLPIRFGQTILAYREQGRKMDDLVLIPLVLAGYARYLRGVDDAGSPIPLSPDPLLPQLQPLVAGLELRPGQQDFGCLNALFSRTDVFGVDLYEAGLGGRIEAMAQALFAGPGAVRKTLHHYVSAR